MANRMIAYEWARSSWSRNVREMHAVCVAAHAAYVKALSHAAAIRANGTEEQVARWLDLAVGRLYEAWQEIERTVYPDFAGQVWPGVERGTPTPRVVPVVSRGVFRPVAAPAWLDRAVAREQYDEERAHVMWIESQADQDYWQRVMRGKP